MKRISLLLTSLLLVGCHSISIPTANGPATVRSFGQKTTISAVTMKPDGTITVKGYNNDQVTALIEALQAAMALGKAAAVP